MYYETTGTQGVLRCWSVNICVVIEESEEKTERIENDALSNAWIRQK